MLTFVLSDQDCTWIIWSYYLVFDLLFKYRYLQYIKKNQNLQKSLYFKFRLVRMILGALHIIFFVILGCTLAFKVIVQPHNKHILVRKVLVDVKTI